MVDWGLIIYFVFFDVVMVGNFLGSGVFDND